MKFQSRTEPRCAFTRANERTHGINVAVDRWSTANSKFPLAATAPDGNFIFFLTPQLILRPTIRVKRICA